MPKPSDSLPLFDVVMGAITPTYDAGAVEQREALEASRAVPEPLRVLRATVARCIAEGAPVYTEQAPPAPVTFGDDPTARGFTYCGHPLATRECTESGGCDWHAGRIPPDAEEA